MSMLEMEIVSDLINQLKNNNLSAEKENEIIRKILQFTDKEKVS